MRTFFIAVAKVFGLLQAYYGLAYITSIIPIMSAFARATPATDATAWVGTTDFAGATLPFALAGALATVVLTFGVAWLLLFRTAWLADKLGLPEEQEPKELARDTILLAGTVLLGFFTIIQSGPQIVSACFFQPVGYGRWFWSSTVPHMLKLALGVLFVLRPHLVLGLIAKAEKTDGKRLCVGGLVLLVFLLLAGRGVANHPWRDRMSHYAYSSRRGLPDESVVIRHHVDAPARDPSWYAIDGVTPSSDTGGTWRITNAAVTTVVGFLEHEAPHSGP